MTKRCGDFADGKMPVLDGSTIVLAGEANLMCHLLATHEGRITVSCVIPLALQSIFHVTNSRACYPLGSDIGVRPLL